jgi:hypothetical protein
VISLGARGLHDAAAVVNLAPGHSSLLAIPRPEEPGSSSNAHRIASALYGPANELLSVASFEVYGIPMKRFGGR